MFRTLLFTLTVLAAAVPASAADMQFPYEAVVAGDDVVVRSGPGKNYYATSRLERGMQLTVHRHDHGGWYMITPPPGSISWIEASLVEVTGGRGIVNVPPDERGLPGRAVVRIGSTLSDDHGYSGRQLASGEEVEILGEQTLAMPSGPVRMLQITPPLREYRWVKGDFIVPADAGLRQLADNDPYAVPTSHRGTEAAVAIAALPELPSPSRTMDAEPKAEKKTAEAEAAPSPEVLATHQQRMELLEIDNRYADMMSTDISQWRLAELRAAYEALQHGADPALAGKIDVRLSALAEREKLYANYAKFAAVTAATERRDAELLGMAPPTMEVAVPASGSMLAQSSPAVMNAMPAAPPTVQLGAPTAVPPASVAALQPGGLPTLPSLPPMQSPAAAGIQQAGGVVPQPFAGGVQQASGVQTTPANPTPFSGAGILQATNLRGAGMPQFMLTAGDGRFLAFIDSQSVDLRRYLGMPVGVAGPRAHTPNLRADLIQVQSVTPVQLAAGARR